MILQYFYQSLYYVNEGVANHLACRIASQSFEVAFYSSLLDEIKYSIRHNAIKRIDFQLFCFRMTQEQLRKEKERDENIKKKDVLNGVVTKISA